MLIRNDGRQMIVGDASFYIDAQFQNVTMAVNGFTANYPVAFLLETEYAGALLQCRDQFEEFRKYN